MAAIWASSPGSNGKQTKTQPNVAFAYHLHTIALPERTWHPDFMKTGGAEYGLNEKLFKEMLPGMFPSQVDSVSLRLGDLLIVGIPGEMAASLGLKIKSEAGRITGAKHPVDRRPGRRLDQLHSAGRGISPRRLRIERQLLRRNAGRHDRVGAPSPA